MTQTFFVIGHPAPGGSKRTFVPRRRDGSFVLRRDGSPVVNVTDDAGERNKLWRKAVHVQARSWMQGRALLSGALDVELIHFLARPKSHYRVGAHADMLRPNAPKWHTVRPDALKLARATEDALTGAVWVDDASNVRISTEKRWCAQSEKPGCIVKITVL